MYKTKLTILFLAILLILNGSNGHSQVKILNTIKSVPGTFLKIVTHPTFVMILDYAVSYMHVYFDASYDAVFFQIMTSHNASVEEINQSMYGRCKIHNIHYYKNMARLALVLKGYCVGISLIHVKDKKLKWERLLIRELGMMPSMMTVWQFRYKYGRYGNAWDTSAEHNGTRYVIPLPTKDIKIALKGGQVTAANVTELSIGSFFLVRDICAELKKYKEENQNRAKLE